MVDVDGDDDAREARAVLGRIVGAVESGDLDASPRELAGLKGAMVGLSVALGEAPDGPVTRNGLDETNT